MVYPAEPFHSRYGDWEYIPGGSRTRLERELSQRVELEAATRKRKIQELQQQLQEQQNQLMEQIRKEAAVQHRELVCLALCAERLERRQKQIDSHLWNIRAANYNAHCESVSVPPVSEPPLHPFKKSKRGFGTPLPNTPQPRHAIHGIDVGDVIPSEFFSENLTALMKWAHEQINALNILLNLPSTPSVKTNECISQEIGGGGDVRNLVKGRKLKC